MAEEDCRVVLDRRGRSCAESWKAEIKAHEHEKRRFVHEGMLKGPTVRMDQGQILKQEREFDPLLQRFRDDGREAKQRALEEKERVSHLNRALDVQIMREQNQHIISMESRTAPLEKRVESSPYDVADANTMSMPTTMTDYNIISNLPSDKHHWAKPEDRPRCVERDPRPRKVQACQLRDFNIVSNRYLDDHEEKAKRDWKLNNLEVTHKYQQRNLFDPVMQKFNEKEVEERHKCCDDARESEVRMRQEAVEPPTNAGRVTAHYDMITHRADDEGTLNLKLLDSLENQRKSRYKARHVDEHRQRMKDILIEDSNTNQRHEFVAHRRWEETFGRGYNIVNNRAYGDGPKFEKLYEPFTIPAQTTWEKVEDPANRSGLTPPPSGGPKGSSGGAAPSEGSRSARTPLAKSPANATPRGSASGTPRVRASPRTLSEAGSATLGSARGRPPLITMSGKPVSSAPPPPPIPGSPVGSVYSRPKM